MLLRQRRREALGHDPSFYVTITHMLGRVLGARFWGSGVKKWWCNTHTSHQQRKRHQSRFHLSQAPSSHSVKYCSSQAPNKRTQLQRIPQNLARERLSLFRWTWRSSCIVPTFTAITASPPLFNQPSSHGTAVGPGPDLLAEEPLSHGTALGQGPDLTLPD